MIGALIGAGASIIGSLFGGGSKKQTTTSEVDYVKMVKNAEKAGFNPLTAIRNGGSAGFTTSTTGATPFSARLADGVAGGVQSFLANFDPFADKTREREVRLVEAQIANLGASTNQMNRPRLGDVPTYTAGQNKRQFGATVPKGSSHIDLAKVVGEGFALKPTEETPTLTNPTRTGNEYWRVDPKQPDASAFEERYGEPGDWIGGVWNAGNDLTYNIARGMKWLEKKASDSGGAPYRAPVDPYDRKMYIPPSMYRGG